MTAQDDVRFAKIATDPRFSRVKKSKAKIAVDSRFSSMFTDRSFKISSKFDKYGRKIQPDPDADSLNSLYREEFSENEVGKGDFFDFENESDSLDTDQGFSSGELESESEPEQQEITLEHPQARNDITYGDRTNRLAITNLDWDYIRAVDLYKLLDSFKPNGGFVKSVKIFPSEFGKAQMAIEDLYGPVLHSTFQKMPTIGCEEGEDESESRDEGDGVSEDKSEGEETRNNNQENIQKTQENVEITEESDNAELTNTDIDSDTFNSSVDSNEETNQLALKKYKLDRLKYFYAVVECDSTSTASIIYDCCDGAEFEKSSNFLDLRFVPDSITFDERDLKDVATEVNDKTFRPKEFSSSSLQNTTQKLVWDEDDVERVKITKRRLTTKELEETSFDALMASGSDSETNESINVEKYKSLLDNSDESVDPFGKNRTDLEDMEVTFTPGLSEIASSLLDKKKQELETPFEAQLRKVKEKRKEKRKQLKQQFKNQSNDQTMETEHLKTLVAKEGPFDSTSFSVNPDDERFSAVYKSSLYAIDPIHPSFKKTDGMQKILKKKRARPEE